MLVKEVIESIKIIALHRESKINHLNQALEICNYLEDLIDFEEKETLQVFKHILERRLKNEKFSFVIKDVGSYHEWILQEVESVNTINDEHIENISINLSLFIYEVKTNNILSFLKKQLNEIELENFPSITEKLNKLKSVISTAFEQAATLETIQDENEFIIDESVDIESQIQEDAEILTITTGFKCLDKALDRFQSGRIYIFASGTGQGKSNFLVNFLYSMAIGYKTSDYRTLFEKKYEGFKPVILFITNENSIAETRQRLLSIITNQPGLSSKFHDKQFISQTLKTFAKETGVAIFMKYFPPRSITAYDIYSISQQLERVKGYKPIGLIVDYLDRLRPLHKTEIDRIALGHITDELKSVGLKLNIPVITASQLNRQGHSAKDQASITDIGESWQKIQNADAVILFSSEKQGTEWKYNLKIGKIRYKTPPDEPIILYRPDHTLRISEQPLGGQNLHQNTTPVLSSPILQNQQMFF